MSKQPIKATANGFTNEPFYLIQSNSIEKRYVVSLRNKIRIRTLLAGFINQIEDDVQVKITDWKNPESPIGYTGKVNRSKLHQLMTKHEEVIFHNGYHDLMLRNPYSEEYIVFDEHGLVFIYTNNDYSDVLKNLEAAYKPEEKLIYEYGHYHFCIANGQERLNDMIIDLDLKKE